MKISVVTPNYNYAKYIGQTIESVIRQQYNDFEYIIVDDGSTDDSVNVITPYVQRFPKNIFLVQQENRGQTAAINVGMKKVSGDIVCWINSDDTFCEGTFKAVVDCFKRRPLIDIVFGDMNVTDLAGNFMYRRRHLDFNFIAGSLLGFTTVLSSNAVFWKQAAMLENGYFNESLKCNMDGDFYFRLSKGKKFKRLNMAFANFRKQPYTKAAENDKNWHLLVKRETDLERKDAYKNLGISKILPFRFAFVVKAPIHLLRVINRALRFHFMLQKFEMRRYQQKVSSNK